MPEKSINWDEVLIQASISAMQGIQESGKLGEISNIIPEELADMSVRIGNALVNRLKEEMRKRQN